MRKHIARSLIVLSAFSALILAGPAPTASAHHQKGHHCKVNPHTHSNKFYERKAEKQGVSEAVIRRQHKHHKHQCAVYPPSLPIAFRKGA